MHHERGTELREINFRPGYPCRGCGQFKYVLTQCASHVVTNSLKSDCIRHASLRLASECLGSSDRILLCRSCVLRVLEL